MKPLLIHSVAKIALACIAIMFLSIFLSAFYPSITNQMAMGQLENDDFAFTTWEMWQGAYRAVSALIGFIVVATGCSVSVDVYKFFKTRKEK